MSDNGVSLLKRKLKILTDKYGPEAATVCTLTLKVVLGEPEALEDGVTLGKIAEKMDIEPDMLEKVFSLMCNAALLQRAEGAYKVPDWLLNIGRNYALDLGELIAKKVGLNLDNDSLTFSSQITALSNMLYIRIQADTEFLRFTVEEKLASITDLMLGDATRASEKTRAMLRKVLFSQSDYHHLTNVEKLAVFWAFLGPTGPRHEKEMPGVAAVFLGVDESEVAPLLDKARQYLSNKGLIRYVVELGKDELKPLRDD